MGNKPFNISQGSYIGKPQTLHTARCSTVRDTMVGNYYDCASAYSNQFRESNWPEYDTPLLNTYTLNIVCLMMLSIVVFEE
jgi:hypothetical protein